MILAIIVTTITYLMLYGVISFICSSFCLPEHYSWVPFAGTCMVFLIGLIMAIRDRLPDLTRIKWDSGTTQDCPSDVNCYGKGSHLWNMNPLRPQSVASIGLIGGAFLCAGPSLTISAFVTAIKELKKGRQQSN